MLRCSNCILFLVLFSITKTSGQKTANQIFEASQAAWSTPIPKFNSIIDIEAGKYSHTYDRFDSTITFITDSSYNVNAVHAGIVKTIFQIDKTFAIGINFGDYWVFYYGLEKPVVNRGDSVTPHQVIGKLYKENDANDYELLLILMKSTKVINVSNWFKKITNEMPDCNHAGMDFLRL